MDERWRFKVQDSDVFYTILTSYCTDKLSNQDQKTPLLFNSNVVNLSKLLLQDTPKWTFLWIFLCLRLHILVKAQFSMLLQQNKAKTTLAFHPMLFRLQRRISIFQHFCIFQLMQTSILISNSEL